MSAHVQVKMTATLIYSTVNQRCSIKPSTPDCLHTQRTFREHIMEKLLKLTQRRQLMLVYDEIIYELWLDAVAHFCSDSSSADHAVAGERDCS